MYEEIQMMRIGDLDKTRLNTWIEEEVTSLANDFGQNLDNDMLRHICTRLRDRLTTAFKSWYVGDIHAAFQVGLSGGYGAHKRVTVQALFHFLKTSQDQRRNTKTDQQEYQEKFSPKVTPATEFLIWATRNMISLDYVDPGWDPLKEKRISPRVQELADRYDSIKHDQSKLWAFRSELRQQRDSYAEKMQQL